MNLPEKGRAPDDASEHAPGTHVLLDLWGVGADLLDDLGGIERRLVEAAEGAGATVVERRFHRFSPHGVSGVVVLAESHVAIHSWPELGFAALDVFTCGDAAVGERIAEALLVSFAAGEEQVRRIERGVRRAALVGPVLAGAGR